MSKDTLALLRSGQLTGATRLDLNLGLSEFPREIFDLADTLEVLNLSQNRLSELPEDLGRLTKLRILFCSDNPFTSLPESIGTCPSLTMVGFKACQIETVEAAALPTSLRWLILTDNRITELPSSIGNCHGLQKLMLSGNRLTSFPNSMEACENLELLRLAANDFTSLPYWALNLPQLAWLAIGGNPMVDGVTTTSPQVPEIPWSELAIEGQIGEGASGTIHQASWHRAETTRHVAVKVFKGALTSDGLPASELSASLAAGIHDHLVGVVGQVAGHPAGATGLVMPLIGKEFRTLAGPPDFNTCTRDVYPGDLAFSEPVMIRIAQSICSAAAHLHSRNIVHGDLYAHNVLWNSDGHALLGDFGAATRYPTNSQARLSPSLEKIEVRAFGVLLDELLQRTNGIASTALPMEALKQRCLASKVTERPTFAEIANELSALVR